MIRKLDAPDDQIGSGVNVTGPLQVGKDWPGTFFRGDESGARADQLNGIARRMRAGMGPNQAISYAHYLEELADIFSQCVIKES